MHATATADGTGAGIASAQVMIPTARVSGTVRAYAGEGADITGTTLLVSAVASEMKADATTKAIAVERLRRPRRRRDRDG